MSTAPRGAAGPLRDTPSGSFVALLAGGFWPIAVYPRGVVIPGRDKPAEGKEPIGSAWGLERWTVDRANAAFKRWPGAGVGICLGPGRAPGGAWLIDVEGDGPEAEASRAKLFGGEVVETMGWGSARGGHQVLTCDGERLSEIMPGLKALEAKGAAGTGVYKSPELPGLELRIGGFKPDGSVKQVQSVCPPTPGTDGVPRRWSGGDAIAPAPAGFFHTLTGLIAPAGPKPVPPPAPPRAEDRDGRWTPETRAMAYLEKCEPAVSGQRGHDKAFKAACKVGPGFDLPPDTALRLLWDHWNPRCDPPWSEGELRHKVEEAYRVETRRGWLLNEANAGGRAGAQPADGRKTREPLRVHFPDDGNGGRSSSDGEEASARKVPNVFVEVQEHLTNDQACQALALDPEVFHRGSMLVEVIRDEEPAHRSVIRPPGSLRIATMAQARIRDVLTRVARFVKLQFDPKTGAYTTKEIHPPAWCVSAVEARGRWPGVRPVLGVVETPILRPDGSLLTTPGYDPQTSLFYHPGEPFPEVPDRPTRDDAREAAAKLLDLVSDFPFVGPAHKAAWLSAVLSPFARFAIFGPVPLHYFDASCRGTGKSLLTDIVAVLMTGRGMPRTVYTDDDDEMRKRITAVALAGDTLMLIDNVDVPFGGASLDAMLTAMSWRDRILGVSGMTAELPLFTCWFGSGNNTVFRGDITRRIIPSRLETKLEKPEERTGFRIEGELPQHVRERRGELVAAALTILRAHAVAGRPDGGLIPMASFEAWSKVIRSAILWATGEDPYESTSYIKDEDPEKIARGSLLSAWSRLPGAPEGLTTAEALRLVKSQSDLYPELHSIFLEWSRSGDLPTSRSVGMRLNAMRGRVIDGRRFRSKDAGKGTLAWMVETVSPGGTNGTSGTIPPLRGRNNPESTPFPDGGHEKDKSPGAAATSPTSTVSPTETFEEFEV